jgi:hypothetical protein
MKRRLAFLWVAGLGVGPLLWAQGTPRIQFEQTVHDFGRVIHLDRVTGTFTFANVGDAVLKVSPPSTTCGCTVAGVKPDTLQPGEKGELTFTLTLPGYRSKLEKQIFVPSNDPQNPRVALTIKAENVPLFQFAPLAYSVVVHEGAETNLVVQATRTDGQKLVISKLDCSPSWVRAKVEPGMGGREDAAQILVQVKAPEEAKRFSGYVRAFAEDPPKLAGAIMVNIRVVGDLACSPEVLYWNINDPVRLREQRPESLLTRRVLVSSTVPGRGFELRNATSNLKEIQVEVVARADQKGFDLVAKLNEIPPETRFGAITVESNLPRQPKVEVPVTIAVAQR